MSKLRIIKFKKELKKNKRLYYELAGSFSFLTVLNINKVIKIRCF